jgi:hypothetical protein
MLILFAAAVLAWAAASAQYWRALGRGVNSPASVQTLYGDSASNRLLAGGPFIWIYNEEDTVLGMGQAAWDGSRWDSLANRIAPAEGQTYWFSRYQGRLYSCGSYGFETPNGMWNRSLARLDELTGKWEALECVNPMVGGMSTLVPKEPQNTLYATGYSHSLCGYPESCVFRYDGSAFHIWEPFNQIPEGNDRYVGTVFDFQGNTYMTCSLPDPVDGSGWVSFIRWNGTAWEHVPGWNTLSPIKDISIRNDTLYVAGTFTMADGGPGNLVAAFNGEQWNNMGGGLYYDPVPMSGVVWDLEWFHGDLWACGQFDSASGLPAHSIAKWDGQRWCVPPGDFRWIFNSQSMLLDMAVWRDSLYVCGSILTVDGDTMKQVVQWLGGDVMEECSQTVGVEELSLPNASDGLLRVIPQPGAASWTVQYPYSANWSLAVYDATGRQVRHVQTGSRAVELDLGTAAPGIYMVRATDNSGTALGSKVLRP